MPAFRETTMRGLIARGSGPVVLLATGLCNTMPSAGYTQLIAALAPHVTVVTDDGSFALRPRRVREVARALGVASLGYIGHSSFVPSLLECDAISAFVLLDPAVIPTCSVARRNLSRRTLRAPAPTRIWRAEYTRAAARPFVPAPFVPHIRGARVRECAGVGHADLLDDAAADACRLLGIAGVDDDRRTVRRAYRHALARDASQFLVAHARPH